MITIEDFKSFFYRDFPYLPIWEASKTYWLNDEVYNESDKQFYISLKDDNTELLTNSDAWQKTKGDEYDYVLNLDVQNAIDQVGAVFPDGLNVPEKVALLLQYYLAAHLLVDGIRTSNAGLASQMAAIVTGKSVGSVSQQYGIPTALLNTEWGAYYITTQYGLRFLALAWPYTRGNVACVRGATTP